MDSNQRPHRCERCALPTEPCHHAFDVPTTRDYRLSHSTVYINYDGYAIYSMTECRWRSSVDECQRRKFSAKNPEDMLKLGSVASMGLPKYLLIFLSKGDNDELYFRDYLNEHPQIAKEYEALKLELWKRYEHDRDAYTDAKTAFIRKLTAEARRVYGDRY